nr:MAG TPA: hypothetical protein [Caudoviricetes sp.]
MTLLTYPQSIFINLFPFLILFRSFLGVAGASSGAGCRGGWCKICPQLNTIGVRFALRRCKICPQKV